MRIFECLHSMSDTLRVSNLYSSAVGIGTAAAGATASCMAYTTGGSNLFQATSSYSIQTAAFNIYNTSYSASNLWQLLMVGSGATLAPAGSLAFYTPTISSNGGIGMVMTPAGSVGIGTTVPVCPLEVTGIIRASQKAYTGITTGSGIELVYDNGGSINCGTRGSGSSFTGQALGYGALSHAFYVGSTASITSIVMNSSGSVGIGTTPSENLTIYGSAFALRSSITGYFQVGLAGGPGQYSAAAVSGDSIIRAISGNLIILTGSGQPGIYINSSNQVGIGTNNPQYNLHVNGSSYFTSTLLMTAAAGINLYDANKGIIYSGTNTGGSYFASSFPTDGIAVFGYNDGCLGTKIGANKNVLCWNSSGNVGIGTTYPGQTLDVYGTIARSGLKLPRVDYGVLSAAASITIPILFSDTQYNMVEIRIKYYISASNVSVTMAATSTQPAALTFSESGLTTIPYSNQGAPTYYVTATTSTSVILFANNVESFGTYGNVLFRIIRPDATTGGYYRHHYSYDNVYCWSAVGTARGTGMGHIDNMSYSLASITLAPGSGTINCTYSTTHYN